ncbi:alpha/beta hydrolase family protein [Pseudomonas sp. NPDC077186]|uniref:alpha/beta hydrolase family protein n=1 Tax=Pseudomonas sp. NPDC077186 TaxID=3364421 RepID=UPI0037C7ABB6
MPARFSPLALALLLALPALAEQQGSPLGSAAAAETPSEDAAPERPALPERSVSEAQALQQRLEQREQQWLQAGDERFLALWLPANVGEPSGAVILLPGAAENADGATAVGPLRRKLPDGGWHSLSLTLPDPDHDAPPLRLPEPPTSAAAETAADGEAPGEAETAPSAAPDPAADDDARRSAHAQRVMARIDAGIAFARQQQASRIVLLGHGSGAYWAAQYLAERQPEDIHNLLLVAAAVPAGFSPALDELVPQLELATGDFYYKDQAGDRQAALRRLQASKRVKHPTYVQVAMKALPGNRGVEQEQLYRRLRGWLSLNIRAAAPSALSGG